MISHADSLLKIKGWVMQIKLHSKTWIGIIADHVDMWRRSSRLSRESIAALIVDKYNEMHPDGLPGVKEFSDHSDIYTRQTTNSARIFRWLDDRSKEENLLNANFLPVIVNAMPSEIRIHCFNEMFRQMNMVVANVDEPSQDNKSQNKNPLAHLKEILKESSDACNAVAELIDGETYEELIKAQQELLELVSASSNALNHVNAKLAAMNILPISKQNS